MVRLVLCLCLLLLGCGPDAPPPAGTTTTPVADMVASLSSEPTIENGVQIANVTAGPSGFEPASVRLRAGMPARIVFTRTADTACNRHVQVPALGVPLTALSAHEPVAIAFTPDTSGTFAFTCALAHPHGTIVVAR